MRKIYLVFILLYCFSVRSVAQISMASSSSYSQDFNSLLSSGSATWADNSTIPDWYTKRTGTGTTFVANDGSSNAGNLYSYGTGTAADRALGTVGTGNAAIGSFAYGVLLQNTSGSVITDLRISYTGEQWRNSSSANQTVSFLLSDQFFSSFCICIDSRFKYRLCKCSGAEL